MVTLRALAMIALCAACASNPRASSGPQDRSLITVEQMADNQFVTAYDPVQALRPIWLRTRGSDSYATPSQPWVYLDNVKLGDISNLRTISIRNVRFIRYFDPAAAQNRWGMGHAAGVIYVSTRD